MLKLIKEKDFYSHNVEFSVRMFSDEEKGFEVQYLIHGKMIVTHECRNYSAAERDYHNTCDIADFTIKAIRSAIGL